MTSLLTGFASQITRALLLALSIAAAVPAIAGEAENAAAPPTPVVAAGGTYVGKVGGLDAWRVPGQEDLVFRASDGQTIIVGRALTVDGRDLTSFYTEALTPPGAATGAPTPEAPVAAAPPADDVTAQLDRFATAAKAERLWFSVGSQQAPVVYVVVDPTCPFCAQAMDKLRPDVEGGHLQLRVILAPFREPLSAQLSYAIMKAEVPAVAYWEHEITTARGGPSPLQPIVADPKDPIATALDANAAWLDEARIPATPFFFWRDSDGVRIFAGVPDRGVFSDARPD